MSEVLILIPARFGSSRFPGKPMAQIKEKPMIQYIVDNCRDCGFDYAVVTDHDEIEDFVRSISGNVVRVDDDVQTGSERIKLAYERYFIDRSYKYIINFQGDEPLLKGSTLKELFDFHEKSDFDIATLIKKRIDETDFINSNIVKCVYSKDSKQALYFSRSAIPNHRNSDDFYWHQHIGVYSYKTAALLDFVNLNDSSLEKKESLEQLRALENGKTIGVLEVDINLIGVDTPEDIKKVEEVLDGE